MATVNIGCVDEAVGMRWEEVGPGGQCEANVLTQVDAGVDGSGRDGRGKLLKCVRL
jgi:hypothetical protein